ncbi:MAG: non-canonical purine NTP pyrophosphatase, RdgB/HAM1 family [Gammaproteobacteria bacterium]|nr:MAG: non-canonical purine NTP pyrophosphatase, RdgB/HAM1 family [Gammaproteobacteria bacterium]
MIKKIILSSSNPGKLKEFKQLFKTINIDIIPQSQMNIKDVPETGLTFIENALIKARNACKVGGMSAIADDSGIEVDALNGDPGIYSARYGGTNTTDDKNNQKLIENLKNIPSDGRTARYQCALVFMKHDKDPSPIIIQESWEGIINLTPRGTNGFGYDPYFYLPTYKKTAAEISPTEKNKISHRGKALKKLMQKFAEL